jgi:hypothetical protein
MIKWFAYIGLLLIFAPFFLSAKIKKHQNNVNTHTVAAGTGVSYAKILTDTTKTKKQEQDDKKKIKEVPKAKKQPKPEKVEPPSNAGKPKAKRQRRPEGMERPPEIPRRNGN